MHAAYLAEEKPGQGPGFLVEIANDQATAIAIPDPVPLGVDWFAADGARWLWRASSGSGGSLVNALEAQGRMFGFQRTAGSAAPALRTIDAHAKYSWAVFTGEAPYLLYRPGCQHCTYKGETRFRAVITYAYQPLPGDAPGVPGGAPLLPCGLRSTPVVMPALVDSQKR